MTEIQRSHINHEMELALLLGSKNPRTAPSHGATEATAKVFASEFSSNFKELQVLPTHAIF